MKNAKGKPETKKQREKREADDVRRKMHGSHWNAIWIAFVIAAVVVAVIVELMRAMLCLMHKEVSDLIC